MRVIIFTNGEYKNKDFYEEYLREFNADYLICADGGANYARELNIKPNIIIGDMDSITAETKLFFKETSFECYPTKKDQTDTELAISHAIEIGATEVVILGGLGSRMDHSLGNIYLLKRFLDLGIAAEIVNENNRIRLIRDTTRFHFPTGITISILPIDGDVEGLTITGFEYPITAGQMTIDKPYGISNVTNKNTQQIALTKGMLLLIIPKD
jgi:thiamine pyrophosphokinase